MSFSVISVSDIDPAVDAIGVGFFAGFDQPSNRTAGSGQVPNAATDPDRGLQEAQTAIEALKRMGFEAKAGQTQVLSANGRIVIALGLGAREEVTADSYRRAAAQFVKAASNYSRVGLLLDGDAQSIGEGLVMGAHKFTKYKSKPEAPKLTEVQVAGAETNALAIGDAIGNAVNFARDLINEPAGDLTPTRLGDVARDVVGAAGIRVEVWDEARIVQEKLGGLAGVASGSDQPPRLIKMYYEPKGATRTIAFVGKGITFDSGGLSIKPGDGMMTMKTDMSGAAAVIAAMSMLPVLAPNLRVIGIAAATENLPGPSATKPGDVLWARNGKTMEVLNTDAEGRLVLADGLSLAVEENPDAIVDVATLTGACKVALGPDIAGLFGNDDEFSAAVKVAAQTVGERVWELPLHKGYRKFIDSDIADIKNIGPGGPGATTAALFLHEFVDGKPWVHLDIAGPARADSDDGYVSKGGTGFGVRTLIELARTF